MSSTDEGFKRHGGPRTRGVAGPSPPQKGASSWTDSGISVAGDTMSILSVTMGFIDVTSQLALSDLAGPAEEALKVGERIVVTGDPMRERQLELDARPAADPSRMRSEIAGQPAASAPRAAIDYFL